MFWYKNFLKSKIINASLSGEIQTLKLKIECLQKEENIPKQNVDFYQSLLKSLDKTNSENNEDGNRDNSSTNESNKNTVHVIEDSLLQHINPEWLSNNDIKENEKIRCVKHWAAKLSDYLPVLSKITHAKCIILHVGANDLENSSSDKMLNMMDQIINKCEYITENIIISSVIPRYDSAQLKINAQLYDAKLMERFVDNRNIYICDNSNLSLRPESLSRFFNDDKIHINEDGAKVFAKNINFSICESLNIKMSVKKRSHSPRSDKYNRRGRSRSQARFGYEQNSSYKSRRGQRRESFSNDSSPG